MPFSSHPDVSETADACPAPCVGLASPVSAWFAIWVRSNQEFKVCELLAGLGVRTFNPTWSETVQWSDRKAVISRPLFRGYVFARLSPLERHEALMTKGVIQFLPNSFDPMPIPAAELESVRLAVEAKLLAAPCDFVAGELVTVDSGPMAGVTGVVVRTKGTLRVVISVELLRRSIAVELDAGTLLKKAA